MAIVQEGQVFVVGRSAAGGAVPQLPQGRGRQCPLEEQVGEGQVVVGARVGTRAAAVLEEDGLVRVVAQAEVSDLQEESAQAAVCGGAAPGAGEEAGGLDGGGGEEGEKGARLPSNGASPLGGGVVVFPGLSTSALLFWRTCVTSLP